jgi:GT2 family glycosyltransferase
MTEPSTPVASVVIPNWNGLPHLPECLAALKTQDYTDFEIVVVDNASSDDSVAWIRENAPDAVLVERGNNDGFAAAVNAGIRAARGRYLVPLNNDTVPEANWLHELVSKMEDSDFDFGACCMVHYDWPGTVNTAGDVYSMSWLAGVQRGAGGDRLDYSEPVRTLGVSGGAAIFRRSFFDDVGLYDERFFMLHEDDDLNLRALIAGKRCLYIPTAIVRHKVGGTLGKTLDPRLATIAHRNQYIVVGRDLPVRILPRAALTWAWATFRTYIPLRPSRWHLLPERLRQLSDLVGVQRRGFRMGWESRRDVWKRRRIPVREIVWWLKHGVGPCQRANPTPLRRRLAILRNRVWTNVSGSGH